MQGDGRGGAPLLVGGEQRAQVEVGEDVAVEREEALAEVRAELVGGKADRAGGAQRLGLGDVADPRPGALFVAERFAQDVGQEPTGEDDFLDPVAGQPLDHVGEKGAIDQGQRRLRDGRGQRPEPGPFAADEDDGLHRLSRPPVGEGAASMARPTPS